MKKFKKVIFSSLVVTSVLALTPIGVSAAWQKNDSGHWYTEGNSWVTGWKKIDGQWNYFNSDGYLAEGWKQIGGDWYYFKKTVNYDYGYFQSEDRGGEMAYNTIVDGYYLNSSGVWTNGETEIQEYAKLLKDAKWQNDNGIKGSIDKNYIIDINQDGVYEMLVHHGTCEADKTVSVITYNNGDIKIEHINIDHGGYNGYSKSQKVFFLSRVNRGNSVTRGYKLENNHCEEVYSRESNVADVGEENAYYIVNGKDVAKSEYNASFEQFGEIER